MGRNTDELQIYDVSINTRLFKNDTNTIKVQVDLLQKVIVQSKDSFSNHNYNFPFTITHIQIKQLSTLTKVILTSSTLMQAEPPFKKQQHPPSQPSEKPVQIKVLIGATSSIVFKVEPSMCMFQLLPVLAQKLNQQIFLYQFRLSWTKGSNYIELTKRVRDLLRGKQELILYGEIRIIP